ncbi:MAG: hypothetical protein P1V51_01750 [Deltaproteobacteria bacterium]|nr:hypothetical protein [Deltaproteobacteria bacterium]
MRRLLTSIALLLAGTGCATNLSTLQSAETLKPMQVRPAIGGGIYLPVGQVQETKALADEEAANLQAVQDGTGGTPPDAATQRRIIELAASLAVLTPAPVAQGGLRLGLAEGFDVGFAWSTSSWRIDGKLRLRGGEGKGVHVALLAGYELYTFDVRLFELDQYLQQDISMIFDYVSLDSPQRHDFDLRLLLSGKIAKLFVPYAALEYRVGIYSLPLTLTYTLPPPAAPFVHEEDLKGTLHYGGVMGGLAFGPKMVRLYVEVHAGYAYAPSTVYGEAAELGGLAVFPAAGLALTLF